ncbi:MAG: exodeoxyribonuclease VII small subunit [Coriobacteriaceae bacterium]|nr:exodeoxyribonuclease VII small subunit [Coriobacteriaceae bacterium]
MAEDTKIEELSFKEGLDELEGIVHQLEGNQLELEDSIKRYERGVELLGTLRKRLDEAQQKVTVLMGELEPESDDTVDENLS